MKQQSYFKMNYNHLYQFYLVIREGGISNAAEFLGVSQPTISYQISEFQKDMKSVLLEKDGRKLKPTPLGMKLYIICSEIFGLCDEAEKLLIPESVDNKKLQEEKKFINSISSLISRRNLTMAEAIEISKIIK